MKVRTIVIALLALVSSACSVTPAKATRIKTGLIYAPAQQISDPDSPTGRMQSSNSVDHIVETSYVPAELGSRFGATFVLVGSPLGAEVDYEVIWRFPDPGLKNPSTQRTQLMYRHMNQCKVGALCGAAWSLTEPFEVVPGIWLLELWMENKLLLTQQFTVYAE